MELLGEFPDDMHGTTRGKCYTFKDDNRCAECIVEAWERQTIPPVTDESIARARAQQQRDRAEVEAVTGARITDDGRIAHADAPSREFFGDPQHLAEVFGRRALQSIRDGRDPYVAARLAGSFGRQALDASSITGGAIAAFQRKR